MTTEVEIKSATQPWAHQTDGIQYVLPRSAAMLFWGMGTGKSKAAVDITVNRGHQVTLILCPLSVVSVWPYQFSLHAGRPVKVVPLQKGTVAKRVAQAEQAVRVSQAKGEQLVLVMNYEAAWRKAMADFLIRIARKKILDFVIADEVHRGKSPKGKASMFLWKLSRYVPWRLGLTGTPMPHSPLDIFAQFRFLDQTVLGWNFHRFKNRYSIMGGYLNKQVVAFRNMDELNALIYSMAHKVDKRDVLDLPPTMDVERTFELSAKAAAQYKELENFFVTEVKDGLVTASNALTKLIRLQQMTSGFIQPDESEDIVDVDDGKRQLLKEVLEDLPASEPVAVFCRFHQDLDNIHQVAKELGRESLELSGRRNQLAQWQDGQAPLLAIQIQTGKEGVDMTRACYAVYYSLGFSLGDYDQSKARLDRPGQTRPVTYIHLMASGTVDQKVIKALKKKQQVVDAVLKEYSDR